MAATHYEEDEIKEGYGANYEPIPEPTQEYYGVCSTCNGSGNTVYLGDRPSIGQHTEPCWSCDGDGKSERIEKVKN